MRRRKETLGFPVPLGSLALFGVPSCHPWEPASSLSHAGRRGGWKDLQPRCQGGQSGQGCLAKHSHTLPCRGDTRRHPGPETSRPPGTIWRLHPSAPISWKGPWQPLLHLFGPRPTLPAGWQWHLSWHRWARGIPPSGLLSVAATFRACWVRVCGRRSVGTFVTKAAFQTRSSASSKGCGWGGTKALKPGRKIIPSTWRQRGPGDFGRVGRAQPGPPRSPLSRLLPPLTDHPPGFISPAAFLQAPA